MSKDNDKPISEIEAEQWRIWSALCNYKNTAVLEGDIKTSKQKLHKIIFNKD